MKVDSLLWLAVGYGAALSQACGGGAGGHEHGDRPVRKWTKDEIHELERKWGTDVSDDDADPSQRSCGQTNAAKGTG